LGAYLLVLMTALGGVGGATRGSLAANVAGHGIIAIVAFGLTYVFRRYVDRRPWRPIGLSAWRWQQAAVGFAVGTGSLLGVFTVAWAMGWARVTGTELADRAPGAVAVLMGTGLFMYATSAFMQELAFRGYALQTLADGWPLRRAAVASSLIFAVLHFSGVPSPLFAMVLIADIMLMAGFFVLSRLSTGALWLAIGFHTAWNWVMDDLLSMDTDAGPDYGNSLVHVQLHAPQWGLGPGGGVELLYLVNSAAIVVGYWLLTRGRRVPTGESR
jgi:membrane protease YdiL (CAAX protease family)